jgi:hypothetical protein
MSDVVFGGVNSALKKTTPLSLPDGGSGNIMKGAFLSATQGLLRPSAQVALNTLACPSHLIFHSTSTAACRAN